MDGQAGTLSKLGRAAAMCLGLALLPPPAAAQVGKPSPDQTEEARKLFAEGSDLFLKKRYQDALELVQRSYLLVPSPNSALIVARCLRDLERPEEAAERFADAAAQAEARVAAGEQQYAPTAEAARKEGAAVRATLANLRVRMKNVVDDTVVETGSTRAPVGREGLVELLHRPGRVVVVVRAPSGVAVRRAATLTAGSWTTLEVDLAGDEPPPATPPPVAPSAGSTAPPAPSSPPVGSPPDAQPAEPRAWMVPAGIAAGGVGLVGLGMFIGFGLKSRATFDDLEARCAPLCGDAERSEADEGERDAVIANVGLAVGVVGLVGGATLLALGWPRDAARSSTAAAVAPRLRVSVGLRGVSLRGNF